MKTQKFKPCDDPTDTMDKPRPDSPWNKLTPEQREMLEGWLFEENLTYRETLERAQKEFGISTSIPSLAGYYHRVGGQRKASRIREAIQWFEDVANNPGQRDKVEAAVISLIAVRAYELALEDGEKFKAADLHRLAKLLLQYRQQAKREKLSLKGFPGLEIDEAHL